MHNGLPFYSGVIRYEFNPELDRPEAEEVLCILQVPAGFQEALTLSINNSRFFTLPWIPYQTLIPVDIVRQDKNTIVLNVYTGLSRSFEGSYFCAATHRYKKIDRI